MQLSIVLSHSPPPAGRRFGMWIGRALKVMLTGIVGPSLHFCISLYGENKIIGRPIGLPTLSVPTHMNLINYSRLYFSYESSQYGWDGAAHPYSHLHPWI